MTEEVARVDRLQSEEPPVIAPPLYGSGWLDGNSCCDMNAHTGVAMNPLNGKLWAAERFAIDYVQLGPDGTIYGGDRSKPESYPYFGADIHAVADGPVVAVLRRSARAGAWPIHPDGAVTRAVRLATTSCRT